MRLDDRRVAGRAARPAVVERNGDGARRPRRDRRLELVGRASVRVVVDERRCRPRAAPVRGLGEVDVGMPRGRIPVLEGQVEVARIRRTRREVLENSVSELGRREVSERVLDRRGGDHERSPTPPVVGGLRHVDVSDLVLVQVEPSFERDVDRPVRADRGVDVRVPGRRRRWRRELHGLGEAHAAIT